MSLGYIFPLPSPYTEAQLNWRAFEMWKRFALYAEKYRMDHRYQCAAANAIGFASLETAPFEELTLREWEAWRETCQRVKMEEV
jgi:hypothetical protein